MLAGSNQPQEFFFSLSQMQSELSEGFKPDSNIIRFAFLKANSSHRETGLGGGKPEAREAIRRSLQCLGGEETVRTWT